jgi:hypothetical protein
MKTRLAMILSIGGVLTAGSAAALVNTQALGGSAAADPAPVLSASTTTPQPLVLEVDPTVSSLAGASDDGGKLGGSNETAPSTSASSTVPAVSAHVFDVGASGVVTVNAAAGDVLSLVSATPLNGWQVSEAGSTSVSDVQVTFRSSAAVVTFTAHLQNGEVTTAVSATALVGAGATASTVDDHGDDDSASHSDDGSSDHSGSDDSGGSDD